MSIGIIVFGHGSSVPSANDAVRRVACEAAEAGKWTNYETAFLEADPRLSDAMKIVVAKGATEVVVLPYFLTLGIHLQRDLPELVRNLEAEYGVPVRVTAPLDGHAALARILAERAIEAIA